MATRPSAAARRIERSQRSDRSPVEQAERAAAGRPFLWPVSRSRCDVAGMRGTGAPRVAPTRVGRNDPCPCGSGRKFKHCCGAKDQRAELFDAVRASPRSRVSDLRLQTLFEAVNKCVAEKGWGAAIPLFREMAQLDPHNGATWHNLGVACLMVGLSAEAAASFERAAQLRSEKSLPFLVDALELEGRGPEAARVCRKLSRTAVNAHDRRRYLATALILEMRLKEAEKELRPVLGSQPPGLIDAPAPRAAPIVPRRLRGGRAALDPGDRRRPVVARQLTEVRRMTGADRPLLDRMRKAAEWTNLSGTQGCILHFGLGKASRRPRRIRGGNAIL